MIKMLKDWTYSSNGVNCVHMKKGDSVEDVKQVILEDWLDRGICGEEVKPLPEKEIKVVNPVVEIKEQSPSRKKRNKRG